MLRQSGLDQQLLPVVGLVVARTPGWQAISNE